MYFSIFNLTWVQTCSLHARRTCFYLLIYEIYPLAHISILRRIPSVLKVFSLFIQLNFFTHVLFLSFELFHKEILAWKYFSILSKTTNWYHAFDTRIFGFTALVLIALKSRTRIDINIPCRSFSFRVQHNRPACSTNKSCILALTLSWPCLVHAANSATRS